MEEFKVVLKKIGFHALFLFLQVEEDGTKSAQYVVAQCDENVKPLDIVSHWYSGHYYNDLKAAEECLNYLAGLSN